MARAGRPPRSGPITEQERERGRRVAAWIRRGMTAPHRDVEINNPDLARLISKSKSTVGYYVNDCYDKSKDRMIFPPVDTIRLIAEKLKLDIDEGLNARFWTEESSPVKTNFAISGQIPDKPTHQDTSVLQQAFKLFERHAYEGKISDTEVQKVIMYMLSSVDVPGTRGVVRTVDDPEQDGE